MTLLANAIVTSSDVVTISSGTVTLSSAPLVIVASSAGLTQTLTVVNTSSGLVQIAPVALISLGTTAATPVAVLVTSSAGPAFSAGVNTAAGYGPVTSSAGRLCSLSSGTVIMSSVQTVTATAGTNPWSSAPGFNMPVVSVSSGLVQISGTATVAISTGTGSGTTLAHTVLTTIQAYKTAAGKLYSLTAYATAQASVGYVQVFNLATGSVTLGTSVPLLVVPVGIYTTDVAINSALQLRWSSVLGGAFGTAISAAATTTTTGGTVVAANVYTESEIA